MVNMFFFYCDLTIALGPASSLVDENTSEKRYFISTRLVKYGMINVMQKRYAIKNMLLKTPIIEFKMLYGFIV